MKRKIYLIAAVIFLLIAGIGGVLWYQSTHTKQVAEEQVAEIVEEVNEVEEEPDEFDGIEIPAKDLDWDELYETNEDIYAWITVPDTLVDYPVLQHPTDDRYYELRNLDGSSGHPGCINTEHSYNGKEFADPVTILYGHNMRNKTMFGTLHDFEDEAFFNEDHYIFIYQPEKVFVYEVFGAFEFTSDHLLINKDMTNEYVFDQLIKDMYENNTLGRTIQLKDELRPSAEDEDRIIILSTCTRDSDYDRRYLVCGVLLGEKDAGQ